jgi:hypothetical protein
LPVVDPPPTTEAGANETIDTVGAKTVNVAVLVTLAALAEIVTGRFAATGVVLMMNVGDTVAPAATVTDAGTLTLGSLLLKVTTMPPLGAGPLTDTVFVPITPEPPSTEVGDREMPVSDTVDGGVTVSVAVLVTPLYVAEIVTGVFDVTPVVVIVNAGETDVPPATVTDGGTVTPALLLLSVTTAPPDGAGPFNVTLFAVVDPPPTTVFGDKVTVETPGGDTVRLPVTVMPLYVAEIVTGVFDVTPVVVIVNAGETDAPAGTITDAGTVALGSLLASVTVTPPAGAVPFRLTVPDEETPPSTTFGVTATDETATGISVKVALAVTPL